MHFIRTYRTTVVYSGAFKCNQIIVNIISGRKEVLSLRSNKQFAFQDTHDSSEEFCQMAFLFRVFVSLLNFKLIQY